ncbi:hypothetical protein B0H17DRAFT_1212691 [Mycena rosella]|uniref:Uncharacterized protein n=1 Tax=Mycena rosella TaxID=1033263 RepID=A0AAD7CUM4_MYCRO|nr:hypothetical protein B0H17DRAFT_1212691 [Mycena rosella]
MTTQSPPTLTVFFKPRPVLDDVNGTDWTPSGTDHGPFDPQHGPVPPDATEERTIHCTPELIRCWTEFHRIRPALVVPSIDSASPLSLLYRHFNGDEFPLHRHVAALGSIAEQRMLSCYLFLQPGHRNKKRSELIHTLTSTGYAAFGDLAVTLKIWAWMVHDTRHYIGTPIALLAF